MAAARTRVVEAQAARRLRAEGYELMEQPVEELLKLGAEVTALKDVLRARVAEFADLDWVASSALRGNDVSALVRAYERSLDRCERVLGTILRLDLETRLARLAEHQGQLIVHMIEASLDEIGSSVHADAFRTAFAHQLRLQSERERAAC